MGTLVQLAESTAEKISPILSLYTILPYSLLTPSKFWSINADTAKTFPGAKKIVRHIRNSFRPCLDTSG